MAKTSLHNIMAKKTKPKAITSPNIFSCKTKHSGLPGKSYVYVITIDYYLLMFLSYISKYQHFNECILNQLERYYRVKDRESATLAFLDFMAIGDVTRIRAIYPSKLFTRRSCLVLLSSLNEDVKKIEAISKKIKEGKTITEMEQAIYVDFSSKWEVSTSLFKVIKDTHKAVQDLLEVIYVNHKSLIIKILLSKRLGDPKPDHLKSDAYEVVVNLISTYNLKQSKVPFTTSVQWLSKNKKNELIQEECWGLRFGSILSMDSCEGEDEEQQTVIQNQITSTVEKTLADCAEDDSRFELVEVTSRHLIKPFNQLMMMIFGVVEPLSNEEEVDLILSNKGVSNG